ncbi:MAG: crotonase/enoyl-CoA hydratase family protein [Halioglobus sp.]
MTSAIEITIENHIAHLQLNRPDAHNAIDGPIMNGLLDFAGQMMDPGEVRVIVISGRGKSFCAGIDMSSFAEMASGDLNSEREDVTAAMNDLSPAGANRAQQIGWLWQEVPIPVIAAVHGVSLGGGFNLALGADIRLIHPEASLGLVEITWGLTPDMSATQSLRRLTSLDRAKELALTGRRFTGEQALDYGLATEVTATPIEDALALAEKIVNRNPDAVRAVKQVLNQSALVGVAEGLQQEAAASQGILGSSNQVEAISAKFERRAPCFSDPS